MRCSQSRDTIFRYYKVESKRIVLFKSIIEGYEGLAVVRTVDPEKGVVQLLISPDLVTDVEEILKQLASTLRIIPIRDPRPFIGQEADDAFLEGT